MAVKYVSDFSFPSDFGFHKNGSSSVPGKAKGGSTTPMRYREGGKIQPAQAKYAGHTKGMPNAATKGLGASNVAYKKGSEAPKSMGEKGSGMQTPAFAKGGCTTPMRYKDGGMPVPKGRVKMGEKSAWNKDDASSPGSYKKTPPGQGVKNSAAAKSKFAPKDTEDATKQTGNVERMAGWSDFKKGGKVHKKAAGGRIQDRFEDSDGSGPGKYPKPREREDKSGTSKQVMGDGEKYASGGRIKNLGKYAHGGKVYTDGSTQKPGGDAKYEKAAGTPKRAPGSRGETSSGKAQGKSTAPAAGEKRMAKGGLSRGTNPKRNAAIHAKEHKPKGPSAGALASLLGGMSPPSQPNAPGMGPAPPGMAPGMGSPPGNPMGPGMAPPGPGGSPGGMAHGGGVKQTHVFHHHFTHKS